MYVQEKLLVGFTIVPQNPKVHQGPGEMAVGGRGGGRREGGWEGSRPLPRPSYLIHLLVPLTAAVSRLLFPLAFFFFFFIFSSYQNFSLVWSFFLPLLSSSAPLSDTVHVGKSRFLEEGWLGDVRRA